MDIPLSGKDALLRLVLHSSGIVALFGIVVTTLCFVVLFGSMWYIAFYKYWHKIPDYRDEKIWMPCWLTLAYFWRSLGRFWHGFEVVDTGNIPWDKLSGALFILYHGPSPIDFSYLAAELLLEQKRMPWMYMSDFAFRFPVTPRAGLDGGRLFTGPRDKIVEVLQQGHLVLLAPGGMREAVLGDGNYNLLWDNRNGFAKAALEAKVPIIPVFTKNSRESFLYLHLPMSICRYLYDKFRLPAGIGIGGWPVKLRMFLGDIIPYDSNLTTEELANKVKLRMEALIKKHQRVPGSIPRAILERFYASTK